MKQALISSAIRLVKGNVFEQGFGKLNLLGAYDFLSKYEPTVQIHPSNLDLTEWSIPFSFPLLFHFCLPFSSFLFLSPFHFSVFLSPFLLFSDFIFPHISCEKKVPTCGPIAVSLFTTQAYL